MLDLIPRETVDSWLLEHSEIDARLIQTLVDDVERTAQEADARFRRDQIVHRGNADIESQGFSDEVVEYMGLDDRTWALEYIFGTYIPNLHRRSALMSVFAHYESRIEKLCRLYEEELKLEPSLEECKCRGLKDYFNYLQNVAKLPLNQQSVTMNDIYCIRDVRNLVAHSQADLSRTSLKKRKRIKTIVAANDFLAEMGELVMLPGYLSSVVATFSDVYSEIEGAERQRRES